MNWIFVLKKYYSVRVQRYRPASFAGSNYGNWSYLGSKSYLVEQHLFGVLRLRDAQPRIVGNGDPGDPGDPRTGCESAGSVEKALKKSRENERVHATKMASAARRPDICDGQDTGDENARSRNGSRKGEWG